MNFYFTFHKNDYTKSDRTNFVISEEKKNIFKMH